MRQRNGLDHHESATDFGKTTMTATLTLDANLSSDLGIGAAVNLTNLLSVQFKKTLFATSQTLRCIQPDTRGSKSIVSF